MDLAIVTCADLPSWEVDDRPFEAALRATGVTLHHAVWDDPDVRWQDFDAALIRTPWDYGHQVPRFVAWAREVDGRTRLLHGADIVAWNTDKTYLRALERQGVPIAPSEWLEVGQRVDLAERMAARGWTRGFLKPVQGCTARETHRFDVTVAGLAAAQAHADRVLRREALILQPYLKAVESEGELSLILFDEVPSHAVRKVPVPGDFRVQDDFGAHDEPAPCSEELLVLARQALGGTRRCLGLDVPLLYARVDALRLGGGTLVLNELEIVEPSLFFRHGPQAAERFAEAVLARCGAGGGRDEG